MHPKLQQLERQDIIQQNKEGRWRRRPIVSYLPQENPNRWGKQANPQQALPLNSTKPIPLSPEILKAVLEDSMFLPSPGPGNAVEPFWPNPEPTSRKHMTLLRPPMGRFVVSRGGKDRQIPRDRKGPQRPHTSAKEKTAPL